MPRLVSERTALGGGSPRKGVNKRALLTLVGILVAWTVASCCGSLPEERAREQTAFAKHGGGVQLNVPTDPPTTAPSKTAAPVGSPIKTMTPVPSATATPNRGVQLNTPTATATPRRGVQLNAPTITATPTRRLFAELAGTYIARPLTVTLDIPPDVQDLSLSCESSAAKMAARYFKPTPPQGFTDWEWYFIKTIPRHCNPHRGYRGKIDGTVSLFCADPNGYGTYAEPIAEALNKAGIPATVEYGVDYQRIAEEVRRSRPVIVWVSGRADAPVREFDPETKAEYTLLLGEHVWLVIGVSADGSSFLVNDPAGGLQYWARSFPRWDVFLGMSVVVGG